MLKKPNKREIYSGNVVDIYNREGLKQGRAELIRRQPSKFVQDNMHYVRHGRDTKEDRELDEDVKVHTWSYERWLVSWVQHPRLRHGDRSTVEVNYFVKYGRVTPSGYDTEVISKPSFRLLFLEPQGTLLIPEICCVQDFHKVWRSFKKPEVVVLTHNPLKIKELFDVNKIRARIAGTIDPTLQTFQEGIEHYLDEHDPDDFLILLGNSEISSLKKPFHKRALRANPAEGLKWK
jgi:hypothetical protein